MATGLNDSISTLFSANGFYIGSPNAPVLYRMELDGGLTANLLPPPTFTNFHHDLAVGKNGLLAEVDTVENGVANIEAVLLELSPTGQALKRWDMAQIFRDAMQAGGDDPSNFVRDGVDWFHMNSAIYSRAENALYVSSRENFVVKLDYETGRILWLLGDASKHWYTSYPSLRALALRVVGGNPPVGQHSLSLDADGKLLLFNNGYGSLNQPAGTPTGVTLPYSAPVKYAIDDSKRTATATWTFEHGRDIFSDICSSVFGTSSATYLVTYSATESRTHARMLGLDQAGNVAFDFDYPTANCSTAFLAKPFPFDALSFE
ncbi:aryl-sulfate sulfotransferase [Massilia sp. TN1-12]|uniref:aryl-sulfate sulfotransferase n=1 Tax=Massilia paldalensis TaxID=3377675 RepID=UPI00384BEEBD